MKKCSKCGKEYPLTAEYFTMRAKNKDGFHGQCKGCVEEYNKQYRGKNKEYYREHNKQYYKENEEDIKKYKQKYNKQYYEENKETRSEYDKQYYEENKKRIAEYYKQYRKENRGIYNLSNQKYKTRKNKLLNTLTIKQWTTIKNYFNNRCAYCGMVEKEHIKTFGEQLHQEHFIPLSKGGEYTHNNIIPACKSCNSSKNSMDFFEWYPSNVHYSKEREDKILEYLNYTGDVQQLSIL